MSLRVPFFISRVVCVSSIWYDAYSASVSDINIGVMLIIVSVRWKDRFWDSEVFVLACGLNIRVFQIMRWSSESLLP